MPTDDLSREDKLRLEAYREAATQCRWCENLTRVSWSIYFPAAIALAGVLFSAQMSNWMKIVLSLLGFLVSVVTVFILDRVRAYYGAYMNVLKEIESQLGLNLYQSAGAAVPARTLLRGKIKLTNKTVPIFFVSMLGMSFIGLAIWYSCRPRF